MSRLRCPPFKSARSSIDRTKRQPRRWFSVWMFPKLLFAAYRTALREVHRSETATSAESQWAFICALVIMGCERAKRDPQGLRELVGEFRCNPDAPPETLFKNC